VWNCPSLRIAALIVTGTVSSTVTAPEHWLALSIISLTTVLVLVRFQSVGQGVGSRANALVGPPLGLAVDVVMALLLVTASAFYASMRIESQTRKACLIRERVATLTGTVASFPEQTGNGVRLVMTTSDCDSFGLPLEDETRVFVKIRGQLPPASPGDTLIATGVLRSPHGRRNPGGFNEADYLFVKGSSAVLTVPAFLKPTVRRVEPPRNLLALHIAPVRNWVRQVVTCNVPGGERAFLLALLLGERGELTEETVRSFKDSGIVHLLAVSGLHTALVGFVALVLLRGLRLSTRASTVGGAAAVWFYCSLSGFHPSTLRASVMLSCLAASRLLGRSTQLLGPLSTSCVLLLLANPKYIWDPGFQLSYAATFSIVAAAPLREAVRSRLPIRENVWRYVLSPALTTSVAQLGVLPVLAYHFGTISAVAVPTNLLAIPLVSGALVSALCSLAVCAVFPQLASVSFALSWLLLRLSTLLAHVTSSLPGASLDLLKPTAAEALGFAVCLVALLGCIGLTRRVPSGHHGGEGKPHRGKLGRHARRFGTIISGLCLSWSLCAFLGLAPRSSERHENCLRVSFLDVGQGDAAVLRLPDGRLLLIDGGESTAEWDNAERVLTPFLRDAGKKAFDAALITHFHSDHAGGVLKLLQARKLREILVTPADTSTALSLLSRQLAKERDITLRSVSRPDTILHETGAELIVFHPAGLASADTSSSSLNDSSIVVVLRSGRVQFIFTGDVGTAVMDALSQAVEPNAVTVLKAPHHGSRLSLSESFAEKVRPRHVVFSAGRNNRFGHPSGDVVAAYRERGARVFRTDRDGCVSFTVCGDSLSVSTAQSSDKEGRLHRARAWRTERRLRLLMLMLRMDSKDFGLRSLLESVLKLAKHFGQCRVFHLLGRESVRLKRTVSSHVISDFICLLPREVEAGIVKEIYRSHELPARELKACRDDPGRTIESSRRRVLEANRHKRTVVRAPHPSLDKVRERERLERFSNGRQSALASDCQNWVVLPNVSAGYEAELLS